MSDYFLIHRALQIQRLCSSEIEQGIEVPGRFARDGLPPPAVEFLRSVDRIRKLHLGEHSGGGLMQMLRGGRSKTDSGLTADEQELIYDFETQLIELRLQDDPQASQLAARFIQPILKDRSFFFGLKPLAQHADDFAYEFLYPTWLNLYTAMRARSSAGGPRKFSDEQIEQMFDFVRQLDADTWESDQQLVGLLTFVANRFSAVEALELARRLTRCCSDAASTMAQAERITALQDQAPSADVLKELVPSYLLVERYIGGKPEERRENATRGKFPPALINKLRELGQSPDQFGLYRTLLLTVGKIVVRAGGFDKEFGKLFANGEYDAVELLDLCLSADNGQPAFSCQAQGLVAKVIRLERQGGERDLRHVRRFAHHLARRVDTLDPAEFCAFADEFIDKDKNRKILLAIASDVEKRQQVAEKLLVAARSEADVDRFLYRLQAAALIGTWQDFAELERIQRSIKVLQVAKREDSISQRELQQLVDDLRAHLPASLGYLASPGLAGREKSDRLAKMYLTLNEACHLYAETGKVGNFGLVRAAYRNLERLADD